MKTILLTVACPQSTRFLQVDNARYPQHLVWSYQTPTMPKQYFAKRTHCQCGPLRESSPPTRTPQNPAVPCLVALHDMKIPNRTHLKAEPQDCLAAFRSLRSPRLCGASPFPAPQGRFGLTDDKKDDRSKPNCASAKPLSVRPFLPRCLAAFYWYAFVPSFTPICVR